MLVLKRIILFLFLCSYIVGYAHAENFPKPPILNADVDFWIDVYTKADTRSGYIHDAHDLSVVYGKIDIKGGPRANRKHIKNSKAKFASVLKTLATGKRTNLSKEERFVLSLWGEKVSNQRLKKAARHIRFQRGQSDRFFRGMERSGEWRAYIEKTLTDMNLPVELSVLPHVESSFNPKAYSHVGAAGIWQFIRSTGKRYMRIDHVIDERMDPFASTVAAAKLLSHNYDLTQSWPLALTAYNHGVASMRRAINKLGTRDIDIIVRQYKGRAFGFASRNFYVAFLAALEVDSHPHKYFPSINFAKPVDYATLKLESYYFAKDIARYLNISKSKLKTHNRALLASVWSDTKRIPKGYVLRVPKIYLQDTLASHIASLPQELTFSEQTPDEFHYVQRGDTISEIANEYGYKMKDILAANNMHSGHYIRAGQKLRLPVSSKAASGSIKSSKKHEENVTIAAVQKDTLTDTSQDLTKRKIEKHEEADLANQDSPSHEESVNDENDLTVVKDIAVAYEPVDELDVSIVAEPEEDIKNALVLLTDPADYTVDQNNSIEVQASETLGHYAEWLDIRASRLRQINNMSFGKPVVLGKRIKLEFTQVSKSMFEQRRIAYQKNLQGQFFSEYRIDSTSQYKIKSGESVWVLALRKFKVPIWLLRQHNPDLDFQRIKPGAKITVPTLIEVSNL